MPRHTCQTEAALTASGVKNSGAAMNRFFTH